MKADCLEPLDSGGRIRTCHLLRNIKGEHDVRFIGLCKHPDEHEHSTMCVDNFTAIRYVPGDQRGLSFYSSVALNVLSPLPYYMKRARHADIRTSAARTVSDMSPDVYVCDSLESAVNVDFILPVKKVLLAHQVETNLWIQRHETIHSVVHKAYYNYEAKRMASFETETCNRFDMVITVSEECRRALRDDFHVTVPIEVVPTGVHLEHFTPNDDDRIVPRRLVFVGSAQALPNIHSLLWFVSQVLPVVRRKYPDVTLDIVGRDPALELLALDRRESGIRVTGRVDDTRPYLAGAEVVIEPLQVSGGPRVKIYQAMAMRKAVVSSTPGIEGLDVTNGRDLFVADSADDFAQAILELFADPERRKSLALAGYRQVSANCDWSDRARRFVDICRQLAG